MLQRVKLRCISSTAGFFSCRILFWDAGSRCNLSGFDSSLSCDESDLTVFRGRENGWHSILLEAFSKKMGGHRATNDLE